MRKLMLGAAVLALGTACPEVERKVYTFDVKAMTGTLVFENIVTDTPESANNDFMEIVNEVIRGSKVEEQHTGWQISSKDLYENQGRLDGKVQFSFNGVAEAGLFKHDKKSPYVWCASREDDETIISTNGTRLDAVLPGCVAWDRKATKLEVTVRTATFTGGEKPLVDSWKKWAAGEELELTENSDDPFGGSLENFGDVFAGGLADGMADAMAGDATLTLGPPEVKGAEQADGEAAIGTLRQGMFKVCLATAAAQGHAVKEVLAIEVRPDGSFLAKVIESASPDPERDKCYLESLEGAEFVHHPKAWTLRYPMSVVLP